jgi:hypothetical protein
MSPSSELAAALTGAGVGLAITDAGAGGFELVDGKYDTISSTPTRATTAIAA